MATIWILLRPIISIPVSAWHASRYVSSLQNTTMLILTDARRNQTWCPLAKKEIRVYKGSAWPEQSCLCLLPGCWDQRRS
ncbi:hypothetical protein B0H67DRAFT_385932 [Lasiosphaeris hirsuta]|uniref:Secreted protein n=1 Tax=Lasiosphaeris hirsuta TaxID=260670 RepID=A0AA39ZXQ0_9PEZI|nr:hypothetical protein B0H67DRAFT_385932 [Lasiosphaeris hirsuta]